MNKEENKQFKDNWDKLKEWLENNWIESQDIWFVKIINKMQEIERLNNIIKEVREYIENNDLYEQDYDYDYEENLVVGPPSDETARKILLGILDKENK